MNKFFTRVCSVMLAGGAAIGLAYAAGEAVNSKAAPVVATADEAAEEVAVYTWGVDKAANDFDGWTGDIESAIESDGDYANCLVFAVDFTTNTPILGKVAISKGIEVKKNTNYKLSVAGRSVGMFGTYSVELGFSLMTSQATSGFDNGTKLQNISGFGSAWKAGEIEFNSGNLEGTVYLGVKAAAVNGMVSKFMFSDVNLVEIATVGGGDEPVEPDPVEVEAKTVPFSESFKNNMGECTAEDANNDGVTWSYFMFSQSAIIKDAVADDWFFTPAIKLEAGKTYLVKFEAKNSNGEAVSYDVKYGASAASEAMVNDIAEGLYLAGTDKTEFSKKFTCAADGVYNLGFHATSETEDRYFVYGYSIEETTPDVPVYDIPYEADFSKSFEEGNITTIDANGDKELDRTGADTHIWISSTNNGVDYAMVAYNKDLDTDDWLITPGLNLEKGKVYVVEYYDYGMTSRYTEKMEVKYGTAATVEDMTNTLVEPYEIKWAYTAPSPKYHKHILTWDEEVPCYVGFHGISEKFQGALYLYGIKVTELGGTGDAVTNLTGTISEAGVLLEWEHVAELPEVTVAAASDMEVEDEPAADDAEETNNLVGFDVYRDGELIAECVGEKSYLDTLEGAKEGDHYYHVVARYENGVSAPQYLSEFTDVTAVESVNASAVKVLVMGSKIVVLNAEGQQVSVAMANGAQLYNGVGAARMTINAAPGVNIVRIAGKAVKVLVK